MGTSQSMKSLQDDQAAEMGKELRGWIPDTLLLSWSLGQQLGTESGSPMPYLRGGIQWRKQPVGETRRKRCSR